MMRARPAEQIWLTQFAPSEIATFDDAARLSGLDDLGRAWTKVTKVQARAFLAGLLHCDLAYKSEVMPARRAEWLTERFVNSFGLYEAKYATNSPDLPHKLPFSYSPATTDTVDAGIVIIGESGRGLFWVADED